MFWFKGSRFSGSLLNLIVMMIRYPFFCFLFFLLVSACKEDDPVVQSGTLQLSSIKIGAFSLDLSGTANAGAPVSEPIQISFTSPINTATVSSITLSKQGNTLDANYAFADNNKTILVTPVSNLEYTTGYIISVSPALKGARGESFPGIDIDFETAEGVLEIVSWTIGGKEVPSSGRITNVPLDFSAEVVFSAPLDPQSLSSSAVRVSGTNAGTTNFALSEDNTRLSVSTSNTLHYFNRYLLVISDDVRGARGEVLSGWSKYFYTKLDSTNKFPIVSDEELLTLVQQQTFRYFWDFAHASSGMARERNTSGDLVTSGGSGFGIMALIVGIERNFITREQGLERMDKILDFLETADRFHGAWPHWMDGNTGSVIAFSPNDNGGDLVETSFLIQGLITFRQYLNSADPAEQELIDRINTLWESVEWDWYTRGENVLYWHWSPDKEWIMNMPIRGYNEALITYLLAASSPTHTIEAPVYHNGWAQNGAIINGKSFYDITLPVGYDFGGPLFFTHYSFLGLDPRNLSDTYANYWKQNVNHTLINYQHSVINPRGYVGYSEDSWGLTASDNHEGYSAHSPTNDLGVVTPTAALSSFPYTPEQSMKALKFFYYILGDKLWGEYGFYDAFNVTQGWYADSYLAIDQGPIIVMIENYRTNLLWSLFMSAPEVQDGLDKLGFNY